MTGEPGSGGVGRMVRPYTMTGGRTGVGLPVIPLESLVSVTPTGMGMRGQFRWEAARIIAMSRRETAIVELAALLEIPVGVVRVLVADLRAKGAVTITDSPTVVVADHYDPAYADLLEKVLDGIRTL